MTSRTVVVIILALLCGTSAAGGAFALVSKPTPPETVPVVVTAFHLQRGNQIKEEYLTIKQWPKGMVPAGAFANIEDVVDRTVAQSMWTGELVLDMKVTDKGDGVVAFVEDGMRAFTISTRTVSGSMAGMLQPDNRVDVLLTLRGEGQNQPSETITLLQNIEILAVDQDLDAGDNSRTGRKTTQSVTLHVTPDQCNRLNHSQSSGTLSLSLRANGDESDAETTPIDNYALRGYQEPPRNKSDAADAESTGEDGPKEVSRRKPRRMGIDTIRGDSRGRIEFWQYPESSVHAHAQENDDKEEVVTGTE